MTVIALSGMIGAGKTTISKLIAENLGGKVYFEDVQNNELLEKYYSDKKRYGFDLQIHFLNSRFEAIKKAMLSDELVILDRSIYEDLLFSKVNVDLGNMHEFEYNIYERLQQNMMNELDDFSVKLGKRSPDLLIYLDMDFNKTLERIKYRGRDFEQAMSDEDITYFKELQSRYYDWYDAYNKSPKLLFSANELDYEHNEEDAKFVVNKIKEELSKLK